MATSLRGYSLTLLCLTLKLRPVCLRASEGFWEGRRANFGASDRISVLPSLTFLLILLIDSRQGRYGVATDGADRELIKCGDALNKTQSCLDNY